jgi:stearoyl-CoA desaturase (delta-9 desaturase)
VWWAVCARVTAGVFGHWLIGHLAHNHGAVHREVQGAAVQGRNVRFASILTMGECWHNNHHAYPGSARLGLAQGEWDPGLGGSFGTSASRDGHEFAIAVRPALPP